MFRLHNKLNSETSGIDSKQIAARARAARLAVQRKLLQPHLDEFLSESVPWTTMDLSELEVMLARKNLFACIPLTAKQFPEISFDSPIEDHIMWAFDHIYKYRYAQDSDSDLIARLKHGIMHATHVAIFVSVFANLYREFGSKAATRLTARELKLLQLAAIFHDCAREDDGVDHWDHESALIFYFYLTDVLGIPHYEAKLYAEAIANKDSMDLDKAASAQNAEYFEIERDSKYNVIYRFTRTPKHDPIYDHRYVSSLNENLDANEKPFAAKRTIFSDILGDGDILDIIRARRLFDGRYLRIRWLFPLENNQPPEMLYVVSNLILEAKRLIALQGDAFDATDIAIKTRYENADAYANTMADIMAGEFPLLRTLGQGLSNAQLPERRAFNPEKNIYDDDNMQAMLQSWQIYARAACHPAAASELKRDRTKAQHEVEKAMRQLGVKTRSKKPDCESKHGNDYRSITLLGHGAPPLSKCGFLIFNPEVENMHSASAIDQDSGYGKKQEYQKDIADKRPLSPDEMRQQLNTLQTAVLLGGRETTYVTDERIYYAEQNEIIYHVTRFDAIYVYNDANFHDDMCTDSTYPSHPLVPVLEAIELRDTYAREFDASLAKFIASFDEEKGRAMHMARFGTLRLLPIYEYCRLDNKVVRIAEPNLSSDNIDLYWLKLVADNFETAIKRYPIAELAIVLEDKKNMDAFADTIVLHSFYKNVIRVVAGTGDLQLPSSYTASPKLKNRIKEWITQQIIKRTAVFRSVVRTNTPSAFFTPADAGDHATFDKTPPQNCGPLNSAAGGIVCSGKRVI